MDAMTSRGTDTLGYDAAGRLATYTSSSGSTTFTHATTNQRLTRTTAGTTTLYLPGMDATSNATTATAATITRYRTLSGGPVATETATAVYWNCGHHQTSTTCQAPAATGTTPPIPPRRRYQPYGNPRGTNPFATVTDHGFLNQPKDPTGLTYLWRGDGNRYEGGYRIFRSASRATFSLAGGFAGSAVGVKVADRICPPTDPDACFGPLGKAAAYLVFGFAGGLGGASLSDNGFELVFGG
jgi:hypothetical protein